MKRIVAWLRAPAAPSQTAPWWDAGGPRLSCLFWAAVAVQVAALFRQKFLAFMDYPQHLALGAILNRMARSGSVERALYDTNIRSFNSMFHVVVAALAFVMPIERAGETALAIGFVLTPVAMLRLLQATGRPRARAFLVLPMMASSSLAWGFCNFTLGIGIQLLVLARVIAAPRVEPERRVGFDLLTAVLALLGMWAHLLASMIAYELMLVAILVDADAQGGPLRRLLRALRTGLPLLPALLYVVASFHSQKGMREFSLLNDNSDDNYAWDKAKHFFERLNGLRSDGLDARLSMAAVAVLVVAWWLRDRDDRAPPVTRWLLPAALLLYLVIPNEMWGGTFGVYPRVAIAVGVTFLLMVPGSEGPQRVVSGLCAAIGVTAAAAFFQLTGTSSGVYGDFDRILDEAPPNRRVLGLLFNAELPGYAVPRPMQHFPAYYVARKVGEVAVQFTDIMSLPVHYKPGLRPPSPDRYFEWKPDDYDRDTDYARTFDLLLVRSGAPGEDPRKRIFGDELGPTAKVRAHHGRWWLIEAGSVK